MFCLLFAYAAIVYIQSRLTKAEFRHFFFLAVVGSAGAVFLTVIGLTYAGECISAMFVFAESDDATAFLQIVASRICNKNFSVDHYQIMMRVGFNDRVIFVILSGRQN